MCEWALLKENDIQPKARVARNRTKKRGNCTKEGDTAEPNESDETGRMQTEYTDIEHRPSQ